MISKQVSLFKGGNRSRPSRKMHPDAAYEDFSNESEIVYEEEILIDSFEEPLSFNEEDE